MKSLVKHIVVELFECDSIILDDPKTLECHLLEAVRLSGATIIQSVFHHFSPHGVTGVVVIAESHFSVHTWPEYGYCAVDIFTCGEGIDDEAAFNYLKSNLKAGNVSVMEIKRGWLKLSQFETKHKPERNPS